MFIIDLYVIRYYKFLYYFYKNYGLRTIQKLLYSNQQELRCLPQEVESNDEARYRLLNVARCSGKFFIVLSVLVL